MKFSDIKEWWYQFKCWLRPFNLLKIDTLPKTWTDEDVLLVHAMFAVLKRFMDEKPEEFHDYILKYPGPDASGGQTEEEWEEWAVSHREFWKDISEVWAWWQKREEREKALDDALTMCHYRKGLGYKEQYKEYDELEAKFEKEEEWALQTILMHRKALWV